MKYLGISSASCRGLVGTEHLSRDDKGLRELLRTGYLKVADKFNALLHSAEGQGAGRMHRPTKQSHHSLQLWLTDVLLSHRFVRTISERNRTVWRFY